MKKIYLLCLLLLIGSTAFAKNLLVIDLQAPSTGYMILNNTGSIQLIPSCQYDDGSFTDCSELTLTWASDNPAVMTTDSVTGLTTGTGTSGTLYAEIYAYDTVSKVTGHRGIILDGSVVTTLETRPEYGQTDMVLSNTITLGVLDLSPATPQGGNPSGGFCSWTSTTPSVATVNDGGQILGVGVGTTTIRCTINTATVDRTINVYNPTISNNNWYVRSDGGTRLSSAVPSGQCDGTVNAPFPPGNGTSHCAFNNLMYLITDGITTSSYSGAVQPGDTGWVTPSVSGKPYEINCFSNAEGGGCWNTDLPFGQIHIPSGTTAHPTRILGTNWGTDGSTCSTDPDHIGNRTSLFGQLTSLVFDLRQSENVVVGCLDISPYVDCNQGITGGLFDFDCPNSVIPLAPFVVNGFTSNVILDHIRAHGFETGLTGTQGPGLVLNNFSSQNEFAVGINFDDPFGFNGNPVDGFTGNSIEVDYSGCTDKLVVPTQAVSRDVNGNISVVFPFNSSVEYLPGTNIVLNALIPNDLNGTFTVTTVPFTQQSVDITGGTCANISGSVIINCTFTTSTAPTFGTGAFVNIAGVAPDYINGFFEVHDSTSSGFTIGVSSVPYPGFFAAINGITVSAGGTAKTAVSITAAGTGSAETASVQGNASYVNPAHRCYDQADGEFSNGDGVGSGNSTTNAWFCDKCTFKYNMQDNYDMLHASMTTTTFTNSTSIGAEGATVKLGNADNLIEFNNLLIASCASNLAFNSNRPSAYNQYFGLVCRAGAALGLATRPWSHVNFANNTIVSVGFNTAIAYACNDVIPCDGLPNIAISNIQNNLFTTSTDLNNPDGGDQLASVFFQDQGTGNPFANSWQNNIGWNIRNAPTGNTNGNNWNIDPKFISPIPNITNFAEEQNVQTFNYRPMVTSPVISAGLQNSFTPTVDILQIARPNPPSVGAYEYHVPTLQSITITPNPVNTFVVYKIGLSALCTFSDTTTSNCTTNGTWSNGGSSAFTIGSTTGLITGVDIGSNGIATLTISSVLGTTTVHVAAHPLQYKGFTVLKGMR